MAYSDSSQEINDDEGKSWCKVVVPNSRTASEFGNAALQQYLSIHLHSRRKIDP